VGHDTDVGTGTVEHSPVPWFKVLYASHPVAEKHVSEGLRVYEDFVTEDEETSLFNEVEPYLKRLHYEFDHWDDVSVSSIISQPTCVLCSVLFQA